MIKATQLKVTATDDMSVAQLVKESAEHISGPALDLVSSQPRLSKRSNHGRRWTVQDKSFPLFILHSSPQTLKLFAKVFLLPSVKTLHRSVTKLKIDLGFNKGLLDTSKLKLM